MLMTLSNVVTLDYNQFCNQILSKKLYTTPTNSSWLQILLLIFLVARKINNNLYYNYYGCI